MLTPELIGIILWVPFVFILVIAGLIFCITGYKKGLWRSLIGLGVTLVSGVISFFVARIVAGSLSGGVVAMILEMLPEDTPALSLITKMLGSIVGGVLAVMLFSGIFFLLTLILKIVANLIKKNELITDHPGMKWGGLGVRALDTIIYTLLLLIPIYGTIGQYAPTAQSLVGLLGEDYAVYNTYLSSVSTHPLAVVSGNSVFGMIYDGLNDVQVSGGGEGGQTSSNINVSQVVDTMGQAMEKFDAINKAQTPEEYKLACKELVGHLKDNVIEAEWAYEIVSEVTDVIKNEVVSNLDGLDEAGVKAVETVVSMLDMDEEEFKENGVVILDYMEFALESDIMTTVETGNLEALKTEEFYEETAEFLYATETTKEIKDYIVTEAVTQIFANEDGLAEQILECYDSSQVDTPEEQKAEIEAFVELTTATTMEEVEEALAEIPSFDAEAIASIFESLGQN